MKITQKKLNMPLIWLPILLLAAGPACKSLETRIEINAPQEKVWEKFADFKTYRTWNPFVRRLEPGKNPTVGRTIEVEIAPPGGDPMVFRPVITTLEMGKILEWRGRFLMPGVFTGRHRFELIKLGPNRTLFKQTEKFNGILVPFFNFDKTREGFKAMNRKLKERAEQ